MYDQVRRRPLQRAWRKVRENGLKSPSSATRNAVKQFDARADDHILQIRNKLYRRAFVFGKQQGILVPKPSGKGRRPLVLAPVENRIVQRAILEVLQSTEQIQRVLRTPTSFGGIREKGRAAALAMAFEAISGSCRFFVRSDIEGFFTDIPRRTVSQHLTKSTGDDELVALFDAATSTDLVNLEDLGDAADMFPLDERGVAQGNPLSPLMGNILLAEFDHELNQDGIVCLRYIDDFLLLGPSERDVRRAFRRAQQLLADHGLRAYDPAENREKAAAGLAIKGFEFLGCFVNPGFVEPSKSARKKFLLRVDEILDEGRRTMRLAAEEDGYDAPGSRYVQTLHLLNRVVLGWGHAVSFCTKRDGLDALDRQIDRMVARFNRVARSLTEGTSARVRRRVLGVQLLTDIPPKPLLPTRPADTPGRDMIVTAAG